MHDDWQSGERRCLCEGSMTQLNPTSDTDTTAAIDSRGVDIEDQTSTHQSTGALHDVSINARPGHDHYPEGDRPEWALQCRA
jgi:hypothetical protein